MASYIEGTLLISNILLILFSIIYGVLIVRKKHVEESHYWLYFLIACALFFLSELLEVIKEFVNIDVGIAKAILRISFGTVILLAFLTKYSQMRKI